ncbi:uncharacterized protein LOC131656283 [Vicia villosa]|uniref:uncharacterized protein LOC131656283 n=1 Tax=Vicia villosa TaxID=3911 RepID=UPI00273B1A55|nr:uncharacterized protein LOC131656283 [Vicia villosa]
MNPNHHNSRFNFIQNGGIPPLIPNHQNNPQFGNYPYHTSHSPYHTSHSPYQYQQFSSQTTNPIMPREVGIGTSGVQSNDQESEIPQFCTQDSLKTINLDEDVGTTSVVNIPKTRFQPKEDELLIQSWLNVSKDPIVGVDKKGDRFWKRIGEAYNKHRGKIFQERKPLTLKGRWHKKINPSVNKFVGCYKQAMNLKKSGSSEINIISAAYDIYYQDEREKFTFESAWRLLKDEPKWLAGSSEPSAKRTKNSASGAYSSSSNPPTPTSNEDNSPSPSSLRRPIGQKAAKRKEKEKLVERSTSDVKFNTLQDDFQKKNELMSQFARDYARIESEKVEIEKKRIDAEKHKAERDMVRLKINDLQILSKDTSYMDSRQLQAHELLCDVIRREYGLN